LTRHPSSSVWMEAGAYSTVQPVLVRPCSFSCRTTVVSFVSPCARRRAACCLVPLTSNPLCAVHDCTLQLQSICASLVLVFSQRLTEPDTRLLINFHPYTSPAAVHGRLGCCSADWPTPQRRKNYTCLIDAGKV
jgi:hypothetical protein